MHALTHSSALTHCPIYNRTPKVPASTEYGGQDMALKMTPGVLSVFFLLWMSNLSLNHNIFMIYDQLIFLFFTPDIKSP